MNLSPELTAQVLALAAGQPTAAGSLASVTLPIPPSTNNLFFTKGRRRIKTAEYRQWTERALPILRTLKTVPGPVEIVLTIRGKINAQRDADNFMKGVLDGLVQAEVIPDDNVKHVTGLTIRVKRDGSEPRAVVEVRTMGEL